MPPPKKVVAAETEASEVMMSSDGENSTASQEVRPRKAPKKKKTSRLDSEVYVPAKDAATLMPPPALPGRLNMVRRMKAVTMRLYGQILKMGAAEPSAVENMMTTATEYEVLLMELLEENANLKGKLEESRKTNSCITKEAPTVTAPLSVKNMVKPVPTWSVVVQSESTATPKEVVQKVIQEVGPSLGVRIHDVKPVRSGGAVIRTPSKVERDRLMKNEKFKDAGLVVAANKKKGTRVLIRGVHMQISPDDLMNDLYNMNLKDECADIESFKKKVYLISKPWTSSDKTTDVVIEGATNLMNKLTGIGRIYSKWFSFRVVELDAVPCCYRCLSFDHRVRDCRLKKEVCRRCGDEGHQARNCMKEIRCRNCAFKGWPANHMMLSSICPVYRNLAERAAARH